MNNQPPQQPPATNRLQLNFGFNTNNERTNAPNDPRQFPTTPSTFPQPIYPNQNGQQEVWGTQPAAYGNNNNYFMTNPYQATFNSQQGGIPQNNQYRAPPPPANPVAAAAAAYQNDPANGLAQQFAHQNLGGNNTPRSQSPYARQPSPGNQQRPRTAGAAAGQAHGQYGNFLSPQMPSMPIQQPSMTEDEPPAKNPDKYGENVIKKAKVSCGLVSAFFKENVQRARERNLRYVENFL